MIPASVLLLLVKATILLLLALGLTRAMRRASAGTRHLIWLVSFAALLLVPALTAWGPLSLALPSALDARSSAVEAAVDVAGAPAGASVPRVASPPVAPSGLPSAPVIEPTAATRENAALAAIRAADPLTLLAALWACVSLAIGVSIAYAWLAVRRIVRRSEPLTSRDWLDPMYEVADRLGLDDAPRLLCSPDAKMPFACGIRTPTIVLPADCEGWSVERRRAVLLHELAHVRRHDLAGHTLSRLVCAVYWFHPLVWTAAQRLRSESERACDDLALACGARPADYAEHLLDIVTSVRHDRTPIVALAMARPSEFEGRMLAILDPERPRRAAGRLRTASLIGGLAAISLVVGAAAPAERAAAPLRGTAQASERAEPAPSTPESAAGWRTAQREPSPSVEADRSSPMTVELPSVEVDADADIAAHASAIAHATLRSYVAPALSGVLRGLAGGEKGSKSLEAALQGQSASERAELLAKILRTDSSAALRRVAAWGLAEFTEESIAVEALVNALRKDASAAVREMAAWALGDGGDRSRTSVDALVAALRSDSSIEVRETAVWALGELEDESALDALVAALADPRVEIRYRAAWAIGSIEPRQAPRALVALLGDKDPKMREVVTWALYNIEDPAAVPALQNALETEADAALQVAYIRALSALGEQSVDALRTLLESKDERVRRMAVRALAGGRGAGPWPWPWPQPRPSP